MKYCIFHLFGNELSRCRVEIGHWKNVGVRQNAFASGVRGSEALGLAASMANASQVRTLPRLGNTLVILKTDGDLVLVDATLTRYRETARHKVFDTTARALPAIADGKLYARDSRVLKCLDLSAAADD